MSQGRAVVFTQQAQDVEVRVGGAWWPGALLGWRHDSSGRCEVRVRAAVDGAEREVWTGFDELRLPEAAPAALPAADAVRGDAGPGPSSTPTVALHLDAARGRPGPDAFPAPEPRTEVGPAPEQYRRRRHGGDVTAELPAVRSGLVPGRHRAPLVAGRHRAADEVAATRPEPTGAASRPEVDCMTRPLRLGDRTPRPRLVRPHGTLHA